MDPVAHKLIAAIRAQYVLPWNGTHGVSHWARVRENGLRIAENVPEANTRVIELFAVFHDARRQNEAVDRGHGTRGAEFAQSLRNVLFTVTDAEMALFEEACRAHTRGYVDGDVTIQCCWDADRLDLGRVEITPKPRLLCTSVAREPRMIAWADERARRRHVPPFAKIDWGA